MLREKTRGPAVTGPRSHSDPVLNTMLPSVKASPDKDDQIELNRPPFD
jgi:hypothetical protein